MDLNINGTTRVIQVLGELKGGISIDGFNATSGSFTPTSDLLEYSWEHGLGAIPTYVKVWAEVDSDWYEESVLVQSFYIPFNLKQDTSTYYAMGASKATWGSGTGYSDFGIVSSAEGTPIGLTASGKGTKGRCTGIYNVDDSNVYIADGTMYSRYLKTGVTYRWIAVYMEGF